MSETEASPTPLDHWLFLPGLLLLGCLWFAYDGYLNRDPEMAEHLAFNRYGLRVLVYLTGLAAVESLADRAARDPSRLAAAGVHAALAIWLALDGWAGLDPVVSQAGPVLRHGAVWLGAAACWLVAASRPPLRERSAARRGLPVLAGAAAIDFAVLARGGGADALLPAALAALLAVTALRMGWRSLRAVSGPSGG